MIFKDYKYFEKNLYQLFDQLSSVERGSDETNEEFIDRARYNTSAGLIVMTMLQGQGGTYPSTVTDLGIKSNDFTLDLTDPYQQVVIDSSLTIDFTGFDKERHFVVLKIISSGTNTVDFNGVDDGWVTNELTELQDGEGYIVAIYLQNNRTDDSGNTVQGYQDIKIGYVVGEFDREEVIQDYAAELLNHSEHTNISVYYDDENDRIELTGSGNENTQLGQEDVQDYAAPLFTHDYHVNLSAVYNDSEDRIELTIPNDLTVMSNYSTDDLAEGNNLYYTDDRVDSHLSGGTGIGYSTGTISHDAASVHESGGVLEITHNNLNIASDDHHTKYALTDDLSSNEISQIQNINSVTISNTQWGYLGSLDQSLSTTDNPTFENITINSDINNKVIDWFDNINMAGRLWGGEIVNNGDGTITVKEGGGVIKSDDAALESIPSSLNEGQGSSLSYVTWSETTLTPSDNAYTYIYYDGSTGGMEHTTSFYSISFTRDFTVGRVYKYNGDVTVRLCGTNNWNFNRRVQLFGEERFPVERAEGLIIGNPSGLYISMSEGIMWAELVNRFSVSSFDSSGTDTFEYWYGDSSAGYTRITGNSEIDNQNYYDEDNQSLEPLTQNRYGVHWVYVVHDSRVSVLYGRGDYKEKEATEATPPSDIPGLLDAYSTLIGKIIVQKGSATFYSIESPFVTRFTSSGVTDHGSLGGLSDDDHTQYLLLGGRSGQTIEDTITITGNLYVSGEKVQVDTRVSVSDNIIVTNFGESGSGVTNGWAGLEFDRGDSNPYRLVFSESSDSTRIGIYYTTLNYTSLSGTFEFNEEVVGGSSGASGYIITDNGTDSMDLKGVEGTFVDGETITGQSSGASATVDGSPVITDNTQALATRPDSSNITDSHIAIWDSNNNILNFVNTLPYFSGLFNNYSTDDLSEGTSNLYYTDERVDDRVNELLVEGTGITLTYDDSANTLTISSEGGYPTVNQTSHGFDGDFIYHNGTEWIKAQADSGDNAATHFAIKKDTDNFLLVDMGDIDSSSMTDESGSSLVSGEYYYLSQSTAGKITSTKPSSGIVQSVLKENASGNASVLIEEPYDISVLQTGDDEVYGLIRYQSSAPTANDEVVYIDSDTDELKVYDGGSSSWITISGGGGSPGGTDGQLQYNDGGSFGGTQLVWNDSTNTVVYDKEGSVSADSSIMFLMNSNTDYTTDHDYINFQSAGVDIGNIGVINSGHFILSSNYDTLELHSAYRVNIVSSDKVLISTGTDKELDLSNTGFITLSDIVDTSGRSTYPTGSKGRIVRLSGHSSDPDGLYYYNGSNWIDLTRTGSPAGSDGALQYNDGGSFGGTGLIWNDSTNTFGWGVSAEDKVFFKIQSSDTYATDYEFLKLGLKDGGDGSFDEMITLKNVYDTATILLDAASSQPVEGSLEGTYGLYLRDNAYTDNYVRISDNETLLASNYIGFFGATPVSKPSSLTAKNTSTVDSTYGTEERDVIQNNRTRLDELEAKLQNLGLIS